MADKEKNKCFVLMPFTVKEEQQGKYPDENHWTEVYEGLIVPAVEKAGLEPQREDGDVGSKLIRENILRNIETYDLILCDLSGLNSNVFFELGWAMRADKRFLLIKDDLTEYAFDTGDHSTVTYNHLLQPRGLKANVNEISKFIVSTMKDSSRRYSMVRRLEIVQANIKAAHEGDAQSGLLIELLNEVRNLRKQRFSSPKPSPLYTPDTSETDTLLNYESTMRRLWGTDILPKDMDMNMNAHLNATALVHYTIVKFSHLSINPKVHQLLLRDIDHDKYMTLGDIDRVVEAAKSAVEEYARIRPDLFKTGTDFITKSLGFVDKEFRANHPFCEATLAAFEKLEYLVQDD